MRTRWLESNTNCWLIFLWESSKGKESRRNTDVDKIRVVVERREEKSHRSRKLGIREQEVKLRKSESNTNYWLITKMKESYKLRVVEEREEERRHGAEKWRWFLMLRKFDDWKAPQVIDSICLEPCWEVNWDKGEVKREPLMRFTKRKGTRQNTTEGR